MEGVSNIQVSTGGMWEKRNGTPRPEVLRAINAQAPRRMRTSIDAARDTTHYAKHWANADALDADSANSKSVRHKLYHRSRYEASSNGVYDGLLGTHTNSVIGIGPKLRMLTRNAPFNQLIEREFYAWATRIQLRRKLWCMAHARYQDGEGFMMLVQNPAITSGVQLDLLQFEAEQCQTPFPPAQPVGFVDGIWFDQWNNIEFYDVLPFHPGATAQWSYEKPVRVYPRSMLHWFKLKRPGTHRGRPACTSSLNLGADSRRFREATIGKAEIEADYTVMLESQFDPDTSDPIEPMVEIPIEKRMMVTLPSGAVAKQLENRTPGAQYEDFTRCQDRELGAPTQTPVNVVQKDSSNYSFASGKLDTILYGVEVDVERSDCNELVMDKIFKEWFAEWSLLNRDQRVPDEDMGPLHQWDWPAKPVIDAVGEANATDTELKNGSITLREVHSRKGEDYEDNLQVMAEDWFGEASEANIKLARSINLMRNLPDAIVTLVAPKLGFEIQPPAGTAPAPAEEEDLKLAASTK